MMRVDPTTCSRHRPAHNGDRRAGGPALPGVLGRAPFLRNYLAFIFWFWLWGPVGAVLSTPIVLVAMVAQEEFARYRKAQLDEVARPPAEPAPQAA